MKDSIQESNLSTNNSNHYKYIVVMKYIDSEKLIAEIERFKATEYGGNTLGDDVANGALDYVLEEIIPSLQQEQPQLPGIEDPGIPGKDFIPVEWVDACEMYGKWKIVKLDQPEVDLEKEIHVK